MESCVEGRARGHSPRRALEPRFSRPSAPPTHLVCSGSGGAVRTAPRVELEVLGARGDATSSHGARRSSRVLVSCPLSSSRFLVPGTPFRRPSLCAGSPPPTSLLLSQRLAAEYRDYFRREGKDFQAGGTEVTGT